MNISTIPTLSDNTFTWEKTFSSHEDIRVTLNTTTGEVRCFALIWNGCDDYDPCELTLAEGVKWLGATKFFVPNFGSEKLWSFTSLIGASGDNAFSSCAE